MRVKELYNVNKWPDSVPGYKMRDDTTYHDSLAFRGGFAGSPQHKAYFFQNPIDRKYVVLPYKKGRKLE